MRIGAHVSTSGGIHTAVARAVDIGANCVQVFAGAPQRWLEARFADDDIESFRQLSAQADVRPAFIHSSYLINLASSDEELRRKSIGSLISALKWADILGASGVITHLGSSKNGDPAEAMNFVGESLDLVLSGSPPSANLLLETCAGQGNTIGRRFEQIGELVRRLDSAPRLHVCLDTAHIFAAGYDIATPAGLEATLREFDDHVGLERLTAIHVNDSKSALGSNVDRHENIGLGQIGEDALALVLRHPRLRGTPFLLEVPGFDGKGPDKLNIQTLRRLAGLDRA